MKLEVTLGGHFLMPIVVDISLRTGPLLNKKIAQKMQFEINFGIVGGRLLIPIDRAMHLTPVPLSTTKITETMKFEVTFWVAL